jgi:hypothetical protein
VPANAHSLTIIQNNNLICIHYCADPLGDNNHSCVSRFFPQRRPQPGICFIVKGRKTVIKKKENPFLNSVRERDDVFVIDLDTWEYQDAVEKVRSYIKVVSG